jgi:phosphatidylinositol-3-phosphatase
MMKKLLSVIFIAIIGLGNANSQTLPKPDHVVIIMFENTSYNAIMASSSAPYIKSLGMDTSNALMKSSFGITHPSQPNYIALYSGSTQGVTDDKLPLNRPFTTPNLGSSLIAKGFTFTGYSENLPSVGWNGEYSNGYGRKHNPWSNWQGSSSNGVPASSNQPFTAFPQGNFNSLPTVSFVIPTDDHNMHNPGGTITAINNGDNWMKNNMDAYVKWAKQTNSLLILTFDEDNGSQNNQITTIFIGGMVKGGQYTNRVDHYNILRTIEDMYGLPYAGKSSTATPITNIWKAKAVTPPPPADSTGKINNPPPPAVTGVNDITSNGKPLTIYPNPAKEKVSFNYNATRDDEVKINLFDDIGRAVVSEKQTVREGKNQLTVGDKADLASGLYILTVENSFKTTYTEKVMIAK